MEVADALKVPELLLLCLERLSPAQLTIAALVCKAWLSVAHDILWRTQMIPFSLLMERLTPGLIISLPLEPIRTNHDLRTIDHTTWTNFVGSYSQKITRMHLDVALEDGFHDGVQYLVGKHGGGGGQVLCPNLKSLRVSFVSNTLATAALVLGPAATSIEVYRGEGQAEAIPHMAKSFAEAAPHVRKLVLGTAITLHCPSLSVFRDLRAIRLLSCGRTMWKSMAGCRQLREIRLLGPEAEHLEHPDESLTILEFPALRELHIIGSVSPLFVSYILRMSSMPGLRRLTLRASVKLETLCEQHPEAASLLRQRSPLLRHLDVVVSRLSGTVMETFCAWNALRSLTLRYTSRPSVALADDHIALLARSAAHLEHLNIRRYSGDFTGVWSDDSDDVGEEAEIRARQGLTGSSLLSLIRYCSALTDLEIPLNLKSDLPDEPALGGQTSLASLTLSTPLILPKSIRGPARFLARHCPAVEEFEVIATNIRGTVADELEDLFYAYQEGGEPADEDEQEEEEEEEPDESDGWSGDSSDY